MKCKLLASEHLVLLFCLFVNNILYFPAQLVRDLYPRRPSGQAVMIGVSLLTPVRASVFIAHRVQHSHYFSILLLVEFHRILRSMHLHGTCFVQPFQRTFTVKPSPASILRYKQLAAFKKPSQLDPSHVTLTLHAKRRNLRLEFSCNFS